MEIKQLLYNQTSFRQLGTTELKPKGRIIIYLLLNILKIYNKGTKEKRFHSDPVATAHILMVLSLDDDNIKSPFGMNVTLDTL